MGIDRRRKWQLAQLAKGCCRQCGKPATPGRQMCDPCGKKDSSRSLAYASKHRKQVAAYQRRYRLANLEKLKADAKERYQREKKCGEIA